MHGQLFYVVVFAASFYAALAVGRLYLAARRYRAQQELRERLDWDAPPWVREARRLHVDIAPVSWHVALGDHAPVTVGWEPSEPGWTDEQIVAFERRIAAPPQSGGRVDGLVTYLGNEPETEQERRLR